MSFISDVFGVITFNRSTVTRIADSEHLTSRSLFLLIVSSIIAGLGIFTAIFPMLFSKGQEDWGATLFFGLIVPIFFCFFFGFDLAWVTVRFRKRPFKGVDFFSVLRDPAFKQAIRVIGYSSLVLLISIPLLLTGFQFYQLFGDASMFWFPLLMFFNPLQHPIVFFLIWQLLIFIYTYNVILEDSKSRKDSIIGSILGFLLFNTFWILVFLAYILGMGIGLGSD
jgi:hypothetical protein